jgi:hypothetical protein
LENKIMTNRTVQIKGYGFGSTPAEITVTLEGTTVFTGTVTTIDGTPPSLPNIDLKDETVSLCTFEVPMDFAGEKAMTCSVTSGTVIFAQVDANYAPVQNPVFSQADYNQLTSPTTRRAEQVQILSNYAVPPFTAEEITTLNSVDPSVGNEQLAILATHGVSFTVSSGSTGYRDINTGSDSRANVVIDGTPTTAPHSPEYEGTWWWKIGSGSTLSYNLIIDAGME